MKRLIVVKFEVQGADSTSHVSAWMRIQRIFSSLSLPDTVRIVSIKEGEEEDAS